MIEFITTWHCKCRLHCDDCRNNAEWRAGKAKKYIMPDECPYILGLGDVVAKTLKVPIVAGVVKALTGIDTHKPCSGCNKRRKWLNKKVPMDGRKMTNNG